jgi:hypothetical protein
MIRIGYEIGTGRPVDIPADRHIGVSGQTQLSGKTTTLEALVHRSGLRAVAFVTKRAESSFRDASNVPPYFQDSADWEFVSSILEAMLGEKLKLHRSKIMDACRTASTLADVYTYVREHLHGAGNEAYAVYNRLSKKERRGKKAPSEWKIKPATGFVGSILTELEAYLEKVIPQIERLPYSKTLALRPGLNVMDLSDYSTEMQSLVIRSVLKWVYEHERKTVVIIPEAWEFIPQNRRSPVLLAAEELIRKGAAAGNYVWLDSQDIAGVHKNVLRSVGVWILGVQREANEVKRAIAHAGISAKLRPHQIMELSRGQFLVCFDTRMVRTYVQPFWVGDVHAEAIARGEEKVESAERIWKESGTSKAAKGARDEDQANGLGSAEHRPLNTESRIEPGRARSGELLHTGDASSQNSETSERLSQTDTEGEAMWKEQFDEAQQRIKLLESILISRFGLTQADLDTALTKFKLDAVMVTSPHLPARIPDSAAATPPVGREGNGSFAEFLRELREHPEVIALVAERPTLRVKIERPTLDLDGTDNAGRLARLIHEGFFEGPRKINAINDEFRRRGWFAQTGRPAPLNLHLARLAEMGFLTVELEGYRAVAGMKVETVGA